MTVTGHEWERFGAANSWHRRSGNRIHGRRGARSSLAAASPRRPCTSM